MRYFLQSLFTDLTGKNEVIEGMDFYLMMFVERHLGESHIHKIAIFMNSFAEEQKYKGVNFINIWLIAL